jgi:hypothetical protein
MGSLGEHAEKAEFTDPHQLIVAMDNVLFRALFATFLKAYLAGRQNGLLCAGSGENQQGRE